MDAYFNKVVLQILGLDITLGQILLLCIAWILSIIFYHLFSRSSKVNRLLDQNNIGDQKRRSLKFILAYLIVSVLFLVILRILGVDPTFSLGKLAVSLSLIVDLIIFVQAARLIDWIISNLFIHRYYINRDARKKGAQVTRNTERTASTVVQYIVFAAAIVIFLNNNEAFDFSFYKKTWQDSDGNTGAIEFKISRIFVVALIFLISRLLIWLITQLILYRVYKRRGVDTGSQYAINQLIKYFIYFIATLMALDHLGINMTLILTGAAALLVGIGLGLQQTFNDFISGIVLLFERTTSVGDILEFDNTVGVVKKIGLRSSIIETRHNVTMVVPNSRLVNDKVVNWTHYDNKVRFDIKLGVSYGTDADMVKKILLESARDNAHVIEYPSPQVRFVDFGASALEFELLFFSRKFLFIEDVKSDLRFDINRRFAEAGITIPFTQMDINIRNRE